MARLTRDVYGQVVAHVELVTFPTGALIQERDRRLSHIYFPITGIAALRYVTAAGASSALAVVGNEGAIGVGTFLADATMPHEAVVLRTGVALRMSVNAVQDCFQRFDAFRQTLLRYTQTLFVQASQIAVCNNHHAIEQRLCRWLLANYLRSAGSSLIMTHELIASMLGVQREGITVAARRLQKMGLIRYGRGHIDIRDEKGLEARVCECHGVIQREYSRLLD